MRKITKKRWQDHRSKTNVYWLHYLLDKSLEQFEYADEPRGEERLRGDFHACRSRIQRLGSAQRVLRDAFFDAAVVYDESEDA